MADCREDIYFKLFVGLGVCGWIGVIMLIFGKDYGMGRFLAAALRRNDTQRMWVLDCEESFRCLPL